MSRMHRVLGACPACGFHDLAITRAGNIVCCHEDCPRPTAAAEVLADNETEHIVQLDRDGFTMRHPLIERLDDALLTCEIHARIADHVAPPAPVGRYRVSRDTAGRSLTWTPITLEAQP